MAQMVQEAWSVFKDGASSFGTYFMLFFALLVFVLWDSHSREKRYVDREEKYIAIINTLSEDVKERLSVIETRLGIKRKR